MPDVPVGIDVRAHVTSSEADSAATLLGYRTTTLEGQVLERGPSGLLLRVPGQVVSDGISTQRYYQRINLAPADVLDLETRQLNTVRTGALVVAGAATLFFIISRVFSGQVGGSLPPSGSGGAHAISIPIN